MGLLGRLRHSLRRTNEDQSPRPSASQITPPSQQLHHHLERPTRLLNSSNLEFHELLTAQPWRVGLTASDAGSLCTRTSPIVSVWPKKPRHKAVSSRSNIVLPKDRFHPATRSADSCRSTNNLVLSSPTRPPKNLHSPYTHSTRSVPNVATGRDLFNLPHDLTSPIPILDIRPVAQPSPGSSLPPPSPGTPLPLPLPSTGTPLPLLSPGSTLHNSSPSSRPSLSCNTPRTPKFSMHQPPTPPLPPSLPPPAIHHHSHPDDLDLDVVSVEKVAFSKSSSHACAAAATALELLKFYQEVDRDLPASPARDRKQSSPYWF
ncbi:hypothetical protein PCANC_10467 [Puccinia coronata f. sp. avenae]|uniref:Uncharacterized protein n=1 Tax=Puccinia coronata f. sp. avenae TaxID=200324 RepID=A0A2N5U6X7_9BASI|nr:hypothetical protein PCANC_22595 [Puccinia coronata f. sp. avenae]PLW20291.1 hypothetical protein PCASD_19733 [Puccinia coronata f. sp. avenae]PLW33485.1 hypothetical protein PCASD_14403 [Puccinia coronata f. sp. avenae]PLW49696.1 hypothetical protein PCANC_10467 [Puccinia coronata f. sp. avenae]